jgi:hypothetical protein
MYLLLPRGGSGTTFKEEHVARAKKRSAPKRKRAGLVVPLVVIIVIAALAVIAMNYHFMITDDGPKVIKKIRWGTADTFVDTRDWGPIDWMKHHEVMDAMLSDTIDELQKDITK